MKGKSFPVPRLDHLHLSPLSGWKNPFLPNPVSLLTICCHSPFISHALLLVLIKRWSPSASACVCTCSHASLALYIFISIHTYMSPSPSSSNNWVQPWNLCHLKDISKPWGSPESHTFHGKGQQAATAFCPPDERGCSLSFIFLNEHIISLPSFFFLPMKIFLPCMPFFSAAPHTLFLEEQMIKF